MNKCITLLAVAVVGLAGDAVAEDYTFHLRANDKPIGEIQLSIGGGKAYAEVGEFTEQFDLEEKCWLDDETQEWVTLAECEKWAKEGKKNKAKLIAAAPEKLQPFVEWSLKPKFKVEATDTTLKLTSGQVDYVITGEKTKRDLKDYFLYARLSAYKKAMVDGKLPPFAELKVVDELEKRKFMPTAMEIRIPGAEGAPKIDMAIEYTP